MTRAEIIEVLAEHLYPGQTMTAIEVAADALIARRDA